MTVNNNKAIEAKLETFGTLNRVYDGTDGITDSEEFAETVFTNIFDLLDEDENLRQGTLLFSEMLLKSYGYTVIKPN